LTKKKYIDVLLSRVREENTKVNEEEIVYIPSPKGEGKGGILRICMYFGPEQQLE